MRKRGAAMRKLTDNAKRARDVLARENAVLPADCERVVKREIQKTLSEFFELSGEVAFKTERRGRIVITIVAEADEVKPFGII